MASETRAELLKELAEIVRPTTLADFERLCSDDQIRAYIAGAKEQLADYAEIDEARKARS